MENWTESCSEKYKIGSESLLQSDQVSESLKYYFSSEWMIMDTFSSYIISAYYINTKTKFPLVGVLAEDKNGQKSAYYLKGEYKNEIRSKPDDEFMKRGLRVIIVNGIKLVHLPTEEPFLKMYTKGEKSCKGHPYVPVVKTEVIHRDNRTEDSMEETKIEQLTNDILPRECRRLEDLAEGEILTLCGISETEHLKKPRHVLKFVEKDGFFLSNYWFEKEMQLNFNYGSCVIILGKLKTTPTFSKDRLVSFCKK